MIWDSRLKTWSLDNSRIQIRIVFLEYCSHYHSDVIARYINRMANVEAFAKLAGCLSELRFSTVSDRFLTEINKQGSLKEAKVELLIRSMRFLKLKVRAFDFFSQEKIYPMNELEETADFLKVCAESFQDSHTIKVKHAFAQSFIDMLEPIAAVWMSFINRLHC